MLIQGEILIKHNEYCFRFNSNTDGMVLSEIYGIEYLNINDETSRYVLDMD